MIARGTAKDQRYAPIESALLHLAKLHGILVDEHEKDLNRND